MFSERNVSKRPGARLGLLVSVVITMGAALTGPLAGLAAASTGYEGTWTVAHGGTGQLVLSGDSTYTSTCQTLPTFPFAKCPAPAGTYRVTSGPHGTGIALAFVGLNNNSSTLSLTWGFGDWPTPPSLHQEVPDWNGLIVYGGSQYTCAYYWDSTYDFYADGTMVTTNRKHTVAFALGSHQRLGALSDTNYVYLSETAPGYFVEGQQPGCVF